MTRHLRARFDGRVLIPEAPVELPLHTDLDLTVEAATPHDFDDPRPIEERLAALRRLAGSITGPVVSDEALRRENLYEERM